MITLNILIGVFGYWFAEVTNIPQTILYKLFRKTDVKPFTCGLCLSWWIALTANTLLFCKVNNIHDAVMCVILSGVASMTAVLTYEIHAAIKRI
jgi:hypothetical protein